MQDKLRPAASERTSRVSVRNRRMQVMSNARSPDTLSSVSSHDSGSLGPRNVCHHRRRFNGSAGHLRTLHSKALARCVRVFSSARPRHPAAMLACGCIARIVSATRKRARTYRRRLGGRLQAVLLPLLRRGRTLHIRRLATAGKRKLYRRPALPALAEGSRLSTTTAAWRVTRIIVWRRPSSYL